MYTLSFKTKYIFDNRQDGVAVPVALKFAKLALPLLAKIDTGADHCIFERGYAEALGIDVETGDRKNFRTVAGSFVAFGHELIMEILDQELLAVVFFYAEPEKTKNVLGRNGFLNQIRLALIDHDSAVYCSFYNDV